MLSFFLLFATAIAIALGIEAPTVPVLPFTPEPIHITLADLPAPYNASSAAKLAIVVGVPSNATLFIPDTSFRITIYRDDVQSPRHMIYTPIGEILVTEAGGNRISILSGDDRSVFADRSNGISQAFGMAFAKGYCYAVTAGNLRRYPFKNGDKKLQGTGEVVVTYPSTHHWTRSLIISPNGDRLFLSVGSGSNVDIEYPPRASVQVANLDGTNQATFASGMRNPVGIDFHPETGDLYVAVQERDQIEDDLVLDYFTKIENDQFYGWPFASLSPKNLDPRRRFPNGTSEHPDLVERTLTPDVLFEAHSPVLDMQFYRGSQLPSRYQNCAFAAFYGSWDRHNGTGYKVIFIPFGNDNRPLGYYEEFIKGFLIDPEGPTTWGRPVEIFQMTDGSLLFTEDANSRLYRVEYIKSNDDSAEVPLNSVVTITINIILFLSLIFSSFLFM